MKLRIINYLSAFLMIVLIYACNSSPKEEPKASANTDENIVQLSAEQLKQIDLQISQLQARSISSTLKLNGQIDATPQNLVSVSVPLGGYLKSTQMLPGMRVQKGQLLAVLEDTQYIQLQQDYLSAKNKLSYAQKEHNRQKELHQARAGSDKVLQQAESEFRNLSIESKALAQKLRLIGLNPSSLTEDNISRTISIYSPISGYVNQVHVNIGKYVMPSDILFELVNPNGIYLNLTVFERDLDQLKIGQEVSVFSNGKPDQKYKARVVRINHNLNAERTAAVHCSFAQYDPAFVPGMYMNAELYLNRDNAKALPEEAFVNFESKDYVFVAQGNNKFQLTPVQKGKSEQGHTSTTTDLKGKEIVVKGAYALLMKMKNTSEE